jgi:haloalkane dehalogenase
MGRRSLREDILNAGLRVMFEAGYEGASVRDICAAAGAPQGSFTNHFRSKESFAREVLDRYFAYTSGLVNEALGDKSLSPRQRMKRYLDIITGKLEGANWSRGCLIGDLSIEASSHSKLLRERLEQVFVAWRAPFAACISEAQATGEIDSQFDPTDLAEFLLASWQGAILRMKVERAPAALERFKNIAFETVFKEKRMTTSSDMRLPRISVLNSYMAYREIGRADLPVALFLHGNPTSSYIWRNVMPQVAAVARCVAPDLIGFGQSGKPDIQYRFADHIRFLDAFLDNAGITSAYIVAQDWGTALAFDLAARRPEFVRGLAFMEFIRPLPAWDDFPAAARELFQQFRTSGLGEKLILDENAFIERVLPGSTLRRLTDEEMSVYRSPFVTPESRRPILRFPNELPIAGHPADVYEMITAALARLSASDYPKLLFAGDPGALVSPPFAESFAKGLRNCRVVHLGPGIHYLQEDHPETIGREIRGWLSECEKEPKAGLHSTAPM